MELNEERRVWGLVMLYLKRQGNEEDYAFAIFLRNIRQLLYREVGKLVKSMMLAKVLNSRSETAIKFREGAYRIFNSTIILYQLHNPQA